jgi:hypothetical protein
MFDTTEWLGLSNIGAFYSGSDYNCFELWVWDHTDGGIVFPPNSVTAEFKYICKPYGQKDITSNGNKYGVFMYEMQQKNGEADVYGFVILGGWRIISQDDSMLVMTEYDSDWESYPSFEYTMNNIDSVHFYSKCPVDVYWQMGYGEHPFP